MNKKEFRKLRNLIKSNERNSEHLFYRNEFYIWNTIKIGNNGVFTNFNYEYLANGLSMDDIVKVRNARK